MNLKEIADAELDYMTAIRRKIHRSPELSFQEQRTADLVAAELDAINVPYLRVGTHGILGILEGSRADRAVVLRADMDALPIQETNSHLAYESVIPGVMHACGHDGHVAMLLGTARLLKSLRSQPRGTVLLCFQQAEEVGGGTQEMLEQFANHPVETVFGIHLWSEIERGKISVEAGPRMAGSDVFEVVIDGVGCHGANPNRGADPIIAGAALVLNASALLSRELDPAHGFALTFGKIQGGQAANVIPDRLVLSGTMRNTNESTRTLMKHGFARMVKSTAETHRVHAELKFRSAGSKIVRNDEYCSAVAESAIRRFGMEGALTRQDTLMASENFGDFLAVYPGVFAFVGARNEECGACFPHHHPRFNIDETSLVTGAALHAAYAIEFLQQPK
ncbi:M20 metallopeptidase family protein [Cupriavidus consociatus]|uniref:M20 metallopeptidase family protein n=1 Tax=Cupriavidus consociatus TaxID=2821357 RepID=UPI001AE8D891|nr:MULTISPECIES: amidohydrolase [unclassified Cupriavidus]MBP0625080.1 amidohydrolase [Cupriavidus sp. LEh25]MDK2661816.1 amidohydrolase [Cupriavidus sp. LEh21]